MDKCLYEYYYDVDTCEGLIDAYLETVDKLEESHDYYQQEAEKAMALTEGINDAYLVAIPIFFFIGSILNCLAIFIFSR